MSLLTCFPINTNKPYNPGSDTSSTALASVFFYLGHYPDAYATAIKEIRETFATIDEIRSGAKLNSCVYLRACIDESLRMSPPAGSALWREVGPRGAVVDGAWIPAGYDVGTGIYALHHNAAYFPKPFCFSPERWLEGHAGAEQVDLARSAFTPFSVGPRSCVGKGLALSELTLTLATMLWKYDFKLVGRLGEGSASLGPGRHRETEYQLFDHITAAKDGPLVQFHPAFRGESPGPALA